MIPREELAAMRERAEVARVAMSEFATTFPDAQDAIADLPRLLAEVERLRGVESRLRKVQASALAFIPAHDQATFDMKPVYGCAFAHGVQFIGKGYGEELEALRAALVAAEGTK